MVDAGVLTLFAIAVREREMVRFDYSAREGQRTQRVVEPHALVTLGRRWYLVAWDPNRRGWRTFRLDRVLAPRPAGRRFTIRTIPGGEAAAFVRASITKLTHRYEAIVTYQAPAERLRERLPTGWGRVEAIDQQTCAYHTSDDDLDWLAFRIGMGGCDFTVEGAPELLVALDRLGRRLLAAAKQTGG